VYEKLPERDSVNDPWFSPLAPRAESQCHSGFHVAREHAYSIKGSSLCDVRH